MNSFKTCPLCGERWSSREAFLRDDDIALIGYQPAFDDLEQGTLLFNHTESNCCTTMEVEIEHFVDLYEGPVYEESLFGSEQCRGHCLRIEDLERCEQRCSNAWVREVARLVQEVSER